jgi:hypothetical protein
MHGHRNWPHKPIDAAEYHESFLSGAFSFSREFLYYDADKLVAVGLLAVWHYWWQVKQDITQPLVYALILGSLLAYRLFARQRRARLRTQNA